jgi:hypothetical protein
MRRPWTNKGVGMTSCPTRAAWQHTRGSAFLGWVKDDAQHIADRIGALARAQTPAGAR